MKINSNLLIYHCVTLSMLIVIFFFPSMSFAKDFGLENPIGVDSISGLIRIVVKVIRYIAIPFVVIAIMWAGWQYVWVSYSGKVSAKEHDNLKYIAIGAFVILSAELIATIMENTIKTLGK